ncbi:MAG: amidohydrolase family protein, partial [Phycisphaerales bacterium]|nr:amidohydrolase family protein [Phycisphaerales bacterium]
TEANLGDGIADLPAIHAQGGHVCLGTDSNARISMVEEMRWLEYVQRLARRKRGICTDRNGDIAPWLLRCATVNGARSLGIDAGSIRPGAHADFVALDLDDPSLDHTDEETLAAAVVCGMRDSAVAGACVNGVWVSGRR